MSPVSRGKLSWIDWLLVVSLGGIWLGLLAVVAWVDFTHPGPFTRNAFALRPGQKDGYPHIQELRGSVDADMAVGDALISIGGIDLRGATLAEAIVASNSARLSGETYDVVYEHGGMVRTVSLPLNVHTPVPWWPVAIYSVALSATALLILLRAYDWHLRRTFFVFCLLSSIGVVCWWLSSFVGGRWGILAFVVNLATTGPMATLALWNAFEWTESARHRLAESRWPLLLSIAVGACLFLVTGLVTFSHLQLSGGILATALVLWLLSVLVAFALTYRLSDTLERRQTRWLAWGFAISLSGFGSGWLLAALHSPLAGQIFPVAPIFGLALPIGLLMSILFDDYLDIDRVVPATTTAALLLLVFGVSAFSAIPALADQAAGATGIEARSVQLVLSMGLAAFLVPGYQFLNRRIEAWLFPQREQLEQGFDRLLEDLTRCRSASELTRTAGEGIDRLLAPESIVTYAREGDAFTPVFARGRAVPPAFDASTPLVSALQARTGPLVANRVVRGGETELSPFDRAALETLQVAVIGPTHWRGNLAAFQCLGPKRSGDIYTSTDLALLSAVGSKVGDLLARIDDEAVLNEAREMQSALRRYVPGRVAEEIAQGRELPEGEREVTVFFVDIRGYTSLSEGMQPDEIFGTVNQHTEKVSRIVTNHGGCVVEFGGDGMMAVFGAPAPLEQKEACAVAAAREVLVALERGDLSVGIGIATGDAFVGNITSADRHIWTVIGNTTNLAARLQSLTRDLGAAIAVDLATREAAGPICRGFELHKDVRVRGRSQFIDVYALPLAEAELSPARVSGVAS